MLLGLPKEIILAITKHLDPGALFNFATTCKALYDRLYSLIKTQQDLAEKFSEIHDSHPLNIVTILRRVLTDPSIAWHVRTLHIYVERKTSSLWHGVKIWHWDLFPRPCKVQNYAAFDKLYSFLYEQWQDFTILWPEKDDYSHSSVHRREAKRYFIPNYHGFSLQDGATSFFSSAELEVFGDIFSCFNHENKSILIQEGDENLLSTLLIACAPRLHNLYFHHEFPRNQNWIDQDALFSSLFGTELWDQNPALSWQYIRSQFLPIFRNLQLIDLGDRKNSCFLELRYQIQLNHVRAFSQLPNLRALRFLQYLRNSARLYYNFEFQIQGGAGRELGTAISMMYRGPDSEYMEPNGVERPLDRHTLHGYDWCADTIYDIQSEDALREQSLELLILAKQTNADFATPPGRTANLKTLVVDIQHFLRFYVSAKAMHSLIPYSLEHLMIHGDRFSWSFQNANQLSLEDVRMIENFSQKLISELVHLISSGRLSNLRSLCLTQIWGDCPPDSLKQFTTLCTKQGIVVHFWSGSLRPEARTCPNLCAAYPRNQKPGRLPPKMRPRLNLTIFNWITKEYEKHPQSWPPNGNLQPVLSEEEYPKRNLLEDWDTDLLKQQAKQIQQDIEGMYADPNLGGDLYSISRAMRECAEMLRERYGIEEDKKKQLKETMELAHRVVQQLGGSNGRLVCRDYTWQRIED